jgi:hypothetical protein
MAFLSVALLCASSTQAQDTIRFKNGIVKAVKLTEINPLSVKYYSFDNLTGPTYVSDLSDIDRIRYINGRVDSFAVKPLNAADQAIPPKREKRIKTQPLLMVFAGGGLGLGSASLEHGQMRTFYNADISAVYKKFIGTLRYVKSEELQISAGLIGPEFNSLIFPIEHSQETALLAGINQYTPIFLYNVSAGCSIQNSLVRGKNINGNNYEGIGIRNTVGVPIEAQIIRHWVCFGLGVKVYGNFNKVVNTGGIMFTMKLGYFGY